MVLVEKKKKLKLRGAVNARSNLACHQNISRKRRIHKRREVCGLNLREEVKNKANWRLIRWQLRHFP